MAYTRHFNDAVAQDFPFRLPFIKYIFDNINNKHLLKLYKCCKLFPNKFPLFIIHHFTDNNVSQHLFYHNQAIYPENDSKIWLTNQIDIKYNHRILPQWISNIWVCTINYCRVIQDISINDLKIMTQCETVKHLWIGGKVFDKNGVLLPIEEIIACVPNANKFRISKAIITTQTFAKLASMERKCKIFQFVLDDVKVEIDSHQMLKFLENQASKNGSNFSIFFGPPISNRHAWDFNCILKAEICSSLHLQHFDKKPDFFSSTI